MVAPTIHLGSASEHMVASTIIYGPTLLPPPSLGSGLAGPGPALQTQARPMGLQAQPGTRPGRGTHGPGQEPWAQPGP